MKILNEQRENPRLSTYLGSSIKSSNDDNSFFSVAKNLSITGAYITTKQNYSEGKILDCIISLDNDSLSFQGEIVRAIDDNSYYGYGLEITDINEKDQKKLEDYIMTEFADNVEYYEPEVSSETAYSQNIDSNDGSSFGLDIDLIKSDGMNSRIVQAGFPFYSSIEDFDFTYQTDEVKAQLEGLMSLDWVEDANNIIFFGPTCSGKTHLAIALGMKALEEGYKTSFTTMYDLINLLKTERAYPGKRYQLNKIMESRVVVVDELGFLPISKHEANLLFQFISKLYGKTSIVMTTDLPLEQLSEAIGDSTVTNLLLNKLTHNIWLRSLIN